MAAPDPSYGDKQAWEGGLEAPASLLFTVTPGTGDLLYRTRALYVGTGGTVVVVDPSGNQVSFTNVANGTTLPIRVDKVLSAGTTASGILGLY